MPQTTNKHIYGALVTCCLALLFFYYTYTNYSLEVSGQNKTTRNRPSDHTIFNTGTTIQYVSSGEAGVMKGDVDAQNVSKMQSAAFLNRRVDPWTFNKTEQILRDSVEIFHSNNFMKPPNEVCEKRPPSAIVIGVQKSGTRELMDFMHLHPHIQIYHKEIYEMDYFDKQYGKGIRWLTEQMPCSFSNQITIMKNAAYFYENVVDVPDRIKKFNASIKLILMVREPIARTYSAYTFFKAMGQWYQEPFDEVIINAIKNNTQNDLLNASIYDESMERWLKFFNLSQILIIEHNEFKQNPVSVLVTVEEFLGLGHYITSDMFVYNAVTGFQCIRSTTAGMSCYGSNRGRLQDPISREIRSKLTDYFKPKNERFFRMIGKSFDW